MNKGMKHVTLIQFIVNVMPYVCILKGRAPAFVHILENIFVQLDYACLKQAELVSPIWSEAVSESKVWKQIFLQNVNLSKHFTTIVMVSPPCC